jgi:shikimate kinase
MKTNVALIGFMGTGKTVVAKILAARLGKRFIELDDLIAQRAGKSIPDIFKQDGEIAFRELEIEVVKAIAGTKNAVIACGGGMVLNKINVDRLKKGCIFVYLTASAGVILKRVSGDAGQRPLLAVPNRLERIKELSHSRQPYYRQAADIIVNTSRLSIKLVARRIEEELKDYESFH